MVPSGSGQFSMQVVQGWIPCPNKAAAHVLGSLLSSQGVHLQIFDKKMIIWLHFVLLQLLPYLFCSKSLSDQYSPYKPNLFTAKSSVSYCQGPPRGSPEQARGQRKAKERSHADKFLRVAEN